MALKPGDTVGIVGGGQLGRMLALAAAPLGFRCHIFCPETDAPAADVAAGVTTAAYDDTAALQAFARQVQVATYEFENIPTAAVDLLATVTDVAPGSAALQVTQDRIAEKDFATRLGIATAPYIAVDGHDIDRQIPGRQIPGRLFPGILKTRRFGYDGKGQVGVDRPEDLADACRKLGNVPAILEKKIDFSGEVSVIVARTPAGETACFPPVWNEHRNHILYRSTVPAPLPPAVRDAAEKLAKKLAQALDYIGILTVELFLTSDYELLVNELAPRVHNSGHWTLEGAVTSQFEQHIRAIAGLPLGSTALTGHSEMINLIGKEADEAFAHLSQPATHLHLYGKAETRAGRKMGHITRVTPFPSEAVDGHTGL